MACLLSWAISTCFYKIWIWFRNTSVQRFTSKLQHLHPQPPHPTPPHHPPHPPLMAHSFTSTASSLPPPPTGLWSWWPMWLTVGQWSSGRHAASSCAHHMWETSLARHGRASPHRPVRQCKIRVRGKRVWNTTNLQPWEKQSAPKASNLLPLKCHLCYRSISWKGLFSSLCCSWRSWPRKQIKVNFSHSS